MLRLLFQWLKSLINHVDYDPVDDETVLWFKSKLRPPD